MKRALKLLLLAAGLGLAAAPSARGQTVVRLGVSGDTAFGAVPGAATTVVVSSTNLTYDYSGCYYYPYYTYSSYCITHARITFGFDPARIDVVAVEPVGSGLGSVSGTSPGSGLFTVTASGVAPGTEAKLFRLRVRLTPGAVDGAYLWVRVDSLRTPNFVLGGGGGGGARGSIGQVCHASQQWGDVDENGRVDSRDALITLSAAVGLPVTGFPGLADYGDVDADGLVNSRDALMMLSYAVDVPTETASRVGGGITDACPAPSAPGGPVVFKRTGPGAGLYRLDSTATSPVMLAGSSGPDDYPRLNAAGTDVVFTCASHVCRSDPNGGGRTDLGAGGFPDWSPSGATIAFLQGGFLSLMASSGANPNFIGEGPIHGANGVAWSRDGTLLAYGPLSGTVKTATPDTTPAAVSIFLDASTSTHADQMRWSSDGANVLFTGTDWSIWSVAATGGTAQRLVAFQGGSRGFDIGPQGILFTATGPGGGNAVWLLKGGPTGPIVRITSPPAGGDDLNPSFRRNP